MDPAKKRALRDAYKSKAEVGGVYAIDCAANGQRWIRTTVDLAGIQSRFAFSQSIDGSPDPSVMAEWERYGTAAFSLTVLEEITRKPTQSAREFADDVAALGELWIEKEAEEKRP